MDVHLHFQFLRFCALAPGALEQLGTVPLKLWTLVRENRQGSLSVLDTIHQGCLSQECGGISGVFQDVWLGYGMAVGSGNSGC